MVFHLKAFPCFYTFRSVFLNVGTWKINRIGSVLLRTFQFLSDFIFFTNTTIRMLCCNNNTSEPLHYCSLVLIYRRTFVVFLCSARRSSFYILFSRMADKKFSILYVYNNVQNEQWLFFNQCVHSFVYNRVLLVTFKLYTQFPRSNGYVIVVHSFAFIRFYVHNTMILICTRAAYSMSITSSMTAGHVQCNIITTARTGR